MRGIVVGIVMLALIGLGLGAVRATANVGHGLWPEITGILMMNKADQSRPLDARIDGVTDVLSARQQGVPVGDHVSKTRQGRLGSNARPTWLGHNELLGGHGDDVIWAGPMGDVIWGDYKPSGQPTTQRDELYGGAGNDWIYASHGFNHIWTGAGNDHVMLVYGHGIVDCDGPGLKTLVMRKLAQNRHYRLVGCRHSVIVPYAA